MTFRGPGGSGIPSKRIDNIPTYPVCFYLLLLSMIKANRYSYVKSKLRRNKKNSKLASACLSVHGLQQAEGQWAPVSTLELDESERIWLP